MHKAQGISQPINRRSTVIRSGRFFLFIAAVIGCLSLVFPNVALATDADTISVGDGELKLIGQQVSYLEDTEGRLTINDILGSEMQSKFQTGTQVYTNFPPGHSAYWIKLVVQNTSAEDVLLRVGNGWIAHVNFFRTGDDGLYRPIETGHYRSFDTREHKTNHFVFTLFEQGQVGTRTFYLRLYSNGYILEAPLYVGTSSVLQEDQQRYDWMIALYLGAILGMGLYNFFIYLSTRDKTYLFYTIFLAVISMSFTYAKGQYPYYWLYRDFEELNFYFFTFNNVNPLIATLFVHSFLKLKMQSRLLRTLYVVSALCVFYGLINLVVGLLGHPEWWLGELTNISLLTIQLFYFLFLALVVQAYRQGVKAARFLVLGWTLFVASIWVYLFAIQLNILHLNFWTSEVILIGNVLEVTLFSFALADRINILKNENEIINRELLRRARENQQIVETQNSVLERKVRERTIEVTAAYKSLRIQNDQLVEINREKDGLIGVLAHDLKSPFNNIKGLVTVTRLEPNLPTSAENYLSIIEKIASNGGSLIDDLLTISLANQNAQPYTSLVKLPDFLIETVMPFQHQANQKGIQLNYHFPGFGTSFLTEEIALRRIIENLVSNAVKFTYPGKSVTVRANVTTEPRVLQISICDEGQGFTEEDKKHVFRKFRKLSARPTGQEGSTGLGLAIVKTLVDRLSGSISLVSDVGSGSEFCVWLPESTQSVAADFAPQCPN